MADICLLNWEYALIPPPESLNICSILKGTFRTVGCLPDTQASTLALVQCLLTDLVFKGQTYSHPARQP